MKAFSIPSNQSLRIFTIILAVLLGFGAFTEFAAAGGGGSGGSSTSHSPTGAARGASSASYSASSEAWGGIAGNIANAVSHQGGLGGFAGVSEHYGYNGNDALHNGSSGGSDLCHSNDDDSTYTACPSGNVPIAAYCGDFRLTPDPLPPGQDINLYFRYSTDGDPGHDDTNVYRCNLNQNTCNDFGWTNARVGDDGIEGTYVQPSAGWQRIHNADSYSDLRNKTLESSSLPVGNYKYRTEGTFRRTNATPYVYCNATHRIGDTGPAPTVDLRVRNTTTNTPPNWSPVPITIAPGDQIALAWNSSNVKSCNTPTASRNKGFDAAGKPDGTDSSVTEPAEGSSFTYVINCISANGVPVQDSITVTNTAAVTPTDGPVVDLRVRNTTTNTPPNWSPVPITIAPGDQIALAWNSSNVKSCNTPTASRNKGFDAAGKPDGTDSSVTEPAEGSSFTYVINCISANGVPVQDSITVTTTEIPAADPTATLRVRNTSKNSAWSTANISILQGEQVALNWSSTDAGSCSGTSFSTGGATSGTQTNVTEPSIGNTTTYRVTCGTASDTVAVTTLSNAVTLTVDDDRVPVGDEVTLTWNVGNNPPETCMLTGPDVDVNPTPRVNGTHATDIQGQSTFVLSCESGATDSVTVEVQPQVFES